MSAAAALFGSVLGTEKDTINCPFYLKMGACRHGATCERRHLVPLRSRTVLLPNLYVVPEEGPQQQLPLSHSASDNSPVTSHIATEENFQRLAARTGNDQTESGVVTHEESAKAVIGTGEEPLEEGTVEIRNSRTAKQESMSSEERTPFDAFFQDVFLELEKFGEIRDCIVCDNLNEHLKGNVYIRFRNETDAERAIVGLSGRSFAGRAVLPELSPVLDFGEACCRQFVRSRCRFGGGCNFLHPKAISSALYKELFGSDLPRYLGGQLVPPDSQASSHGERSNHPYKPYRPLRRGRPARTGSVHRGQERGRRRSSYRADRDDYSRHERQVERTADAESYSRSRRDRSRSRSPSERVRPSFNDSKKFRGRSPSRLSLERRPRNGTSTRVVEMDPVALARAALLTAHGERP